MSFASRYIGRFAPSPTGPLHAGSLVAALASWLDARAHQGQWLVRMEDVDTPRCQRAWGEEILAQLAAYGMVSDAPVLWQSTRTQVYKAALEQLQHQRLLYACTCSRRAIAAALAARGVHKARHGELVYPGTCRNQALPVRVDVATDAHHALRLDVGKCMRAYAGTADVMTWHDMALGAQAQDVAAEVGDFVLRRADGCYSYQLAVVVDDAAQGVTHVVRGADLLDNTARQILLQRTLGYATPQYRHTPLVLAADGQKLSKQNGAQALPWHDSAQVLAALRQAGAALVLPGKAEVNCVQSLLAAWVGEWLLHCEVSNGAEARARMRPLEAGALLAPKGRKPSG